MLIKAASCLPPQPTSLLQFVDQLLLLLQVRHVHGKAPWPP